jgi:hypothetical protein
MRAFKIVVITLFLVLLAEFIGAEALPANA